MGKKLLIPRAVGLLDTRQCDMLKVIGVFEKRNHTSHKKQIWGIIYKTGVEKAMRVKKESRTLQQRVMG